MSVPSDKYATVERLTYKKGDDGDDKHPASAGPKANGIPVLCVEFSYDGDTHTHNIMNGGFRLDNPSLQLLAYINAKPSDFDGQSLEPSNANVPVIRNGESSYALSNGALEMGAKALERAVWFPTELDEDSESSGVRHSGRGGGGGGGGGGSGARSDDSAKQTEIPEGVGVENVQGDRGLTIDVK